MPSSNDAPAPVVPVASVIEGVIVHPLVLLSVTDHYNRVAKDTRKRVVGVLLGESYKGRGAGASGIVFYSAPHQIGRGHRLFHSGRKADCCSSCCS